MAQRPEAQNSFDIKRYFRTFSHREILSCISLALFLVAVRSVLNYYEDVSWIARHQTSLLALSFFVLMILNHAFYRREHKRLNNFLGRIVHDCLFLLTFIVVARVATFIKAGNVDFQLEGVMPTIAISILIIFLLACLELIVAACRRILNLAKWRIF